MNTDRKITESSRLVPCIPIVVLPLFVSIILLLIWHLENRGWPNDDAANYATTAYQIFDRFQNRGVYQGLLALLNVRGLRPILLPTLLVPYLLVLQGNIPLAVGGVLWTLYCLLTFYAYKLCRLFLPSGRAVIAATLVNTSPILVQFATIFFSELSWVCFAIAWSYHLLQSKEFRSIYHSSLAGIFLGLMVLTRPAESIAIAVIPVTYFLAQALYHHAIRWSDLVLAFPVLIISGGLLAASLYFESMPRSQTWLSTGVTAALCLVIAFRKRKLFSVAHLSFWACFCGVTAFWWAGFVHRLYEWAYIGLVVAARVITPRRYTHIFIVLTELVKYYGAFQILWLIGVAGVALAGHLISRETTAAVPPVTDNGVGATAIRSKLSSDRDSDGAHPAKHLALMAVGTLLPILVLYWLSSTGEPRRAMVGMILLLFALSIAALSQVGPVSKLRVVLVSVVPLLQIWQILPAYVDMPAPARIFGACCGTSLEVPFRGQDGNDLMADVLARKLPKNSLVAVYTLALYSPPNRVYEPAALRLGLVTRKAAVSVGYLWDENVVIGRLAQSGFRFLLLDTWDDQAVRQSYDEPYAHFTASLLDSLRQRDSRPPGLRFVASFTVAGREQLLFEITAREAAP